MASNKLTYSKSGVNIPKADSFVKFISFLTRKSSKSVDFKNIGGFGAISKIPKKLIQPYKPYRLSLKRAGRSLTKMLEKNL